MCIYFRIGEYTKYWLDITHNIWLTNYIITDSFAGRVYKFRLLHVYISEAIYQFPGGNPCEWCDI
jgi:hypothetical protein